MMSHKDPDKARHYLDNLDAARCNGRWQEIPELVRKIGKHAPQRQCLCLTARTEQRVATLNSQRPSTSSSLTSANLSQATAPIQAAIEKESTFLEDQFQARVCLAWLHSVLNQQSQVLSRLSAHDIAQAIERFTNIVSPTAKWTHVCIVKGACLRGTALEDSGNATDAVQFYESMLPYLSKTQSTVSNTVEANIWTERLLAQHASLVSGHTKSNINDPHVLLESNIFQPTLLLGPFRVWSEYRAEHQNGSFFALTWVWKAYYDVLSILIQHQITTPIFQSKVQQRTELQKAQAAYEIIIMRETMFPQANQSNVEIDSWVDQVMANWRVMLDPSWQAEDLGQGGNAVMSKNVLDILYRSATRSFHSTRILRHLFTVHAELGEYSLAHKALGTYLEIAAKGKARVEKSGEPEIGLDDDTTAMCTAAAGIEMLCLYRRRAEVEKTLHVVDVLQTWLSKVRPSHKQESDTEGTPDDFAKNHTRPRSTVPGVALAHAYHAIGTSQRCWARLTYETASRTDLMMKAISSFRNALKPELGNQDNIDFLYSLAFAFAEARDIDSAITTVKEAISIGSEDAPQADGHPGHDAGVGPNQRWSLLRCWHLLALLLSARQSFAKAMASCEAAVDPYGGKAVLYGDLSALTTITSLTMAERKGLIELKMTQLSLSELVDGPEEAVNSSGELLGLYAKLFKHTEKETPIPSESNLEMRKSDIDIPQRSIRGSILGYPKDRRSKLNIDTTANNSLGSFEPSHEATGVPAIAITSDNAVLPQDPNHHHNFLGRHESNKLRKRNSRKSLQGGSQRRSRAGSPLRPSTSDDGGHYLPKRGRALTDGPPNSLSPYSAQRYAADEVGVAISHDMPSSPSTPALENPNPLHGIPPATQNTDRQNPNEFPIPPKPPTASPPAPIALFTPATLPEPHYSPQLESRHALSLLAKIWCQISALYRRAGSAPDAQGAIREAMTNVQTVEMAIAAQQGSSAENFSSSGYGGLRSLSELWGDVLAETGALYASLGETAKASDAYEKALSWDPNHADATVGLSAILLDYYEDSGANSSRNTNGSPATFLSRAKASLYTRGTATLASLPALPSSLKTTPVSEAHDLPVKQPNLTALSARDRAYKLLSTLTKSGLGWDDSEAWFAMARAYELGGQVDRAKEALWWVVELEEGRAVRNWSTLNV